MRYFEEIKEITKIDWLILSSVLLVFVSLYHFSNLPKFIIDPFFFGTGSFLFVRNVFMRRIPLSIKNRLVNAFFGGAFIWMFIESVSKLFAKWAVWKFF